MSIFTHDLDTVSNELVRWLWNNQEHWFILEDMAKAGKDADGHDTLCFDLLKNSDNFGYDMKIGGRVGDFSEALRANSPQILSRLEHGPAIALLEALSQHAGTCLEDLSDEELRDINAKALQYVKETNPGLAHVLGYDWDHPSLAFLTGNADFGLFSNGYQKLMNALAVLDTLSPEQRMSLKENMLHTRQILLDHPPENVASLDIRHCYASESFDMSTIERHRTALAGALLCLPKERLAALEDTYRALKDAVARFADREPPIDMRHLPRTNSDEYAAGNILLEALEAVDPYTKDQPPHPYYATIRDALREVQTDWQKKEESGLVSALHKEDGELDKAELQASLHQAPELQRGMRLLETLQDRDADYLFCTPDDDPVSYNQEVFRYFDLDNRIDVSTNVSAPLANRADYQRYGPLYAALHTIGFELNVVAPEYMAMTADALQELPGKSWRFPALDKHTDSFDRLQQIQQRLRQQQETQSTDAATIPVASPVLAGYPRLDRALSNGALDMIHDVFDFRVPQDNIEKDERTERPNRPDMRDLNRSIFHGLGRLSKDVEGFQSCRPLHGRKAFRPDFDPYPETTSDIMGIGR